MYVGVVVLNALFALAGVAILYAARGWETWRSLLRELGLAYMVGLAGVGVLATLALVAGRPLGGATVLVLVAACVVAGGVTGALRRRPVPRRYGDAGVGPLTLGALLTAIAIAVTSAVAIGLWVAFRHAPLVAYDAWNFWIPKAKTIYFFGGLDEELFRSLPAPSYPLFIPALDAMVFAFVHAAEPTALAQQYGFVLLGTIGAVASLLAPLARRGLIWLALASFVVLPEVEHRWFQLLADWTLDSFFAISALLVVRWLRTREGWLLAVLPLPVAAMVTTKREGQLLGAALLAGALVATAREWRRTWPWLAGIVVGAFLVAQVPWRIWWSSRGLESDLEGFQAAGSIGRAIRSAGLTAELTFSYRMWLVAVPLALIGAAAAWRSARREVTFFLTTAAFAFAGFTWVMWANPSIPLTTTPALNPTTRAVGSIVLLSVVCTPIFLSRPLVAIGAGAFARPPLAATSDGVRRAYAWAAAVSPVRVLAALVAVQWLVVAGVARTVRHNGWIYYQGGDQLWYYTTGWLFGHGRITVAGIGYLWSFLLAPIALVAGPDVAAAYPAIALLDVLVLLPVSILALYGIAVRVAGRVFAYWTVTLWLGLPLVGVWYTNPGYHQRYTELLLPQAFGLTAMADFPAMVATLVCAYFCVRILTDEQPRRLDAAAAGVAAGAAFAIKPSAALFPVAGALTLGAFRRFPQLAIAAAGAIPAAVTLAVFKWRGLGDLPVLGASGGGYTAAGRSALIAASIPVTSLDWGHFVRELDEIREHFWSVRVVEWVVIAGAIGLVRASRRIGVLVALWFGAYAVSRGTYPNASFEDGSILRLLIPAYPAFVLLTASLPFLLPGVVRRVAALRPAPRLSARATRLVLAGALGVTAALPLAAIASATPDRAPRPRATFLIIPPIPADVDLGLRALPSRAGKAAPATSLRWRDTRTRFGREFFRVFRSPRGVPPSCTRIGAVDRCDASNLTEIGVTAATAFVDRPPPGTWTYFVGVAANWLDDPQYGDVYVMSQPVSVVVR